MGNIKCIAKFFLITCQLLLAWFVTDFDTDAQKPVYETPGIKDNLPVFFGNLIARQNYSLSWLKGDNKNFSIWRQEARARVMECLMAPPPVVAFNPVILSELDRGSYVARKIIFNITGDSRVLAFMLVPKSAGPHPAVLLLHDHGGKYDIGKEKVIEPWDEPPEKISSARNWVNEYYGGHFIGDELAKKGYVCLALDMLNWSERGGAGSDGQGALYANFQLLGASFSGLIAYEDLRAAEFLSGQPEVDTLRIAAMGLSVGGFRTWQVAALSDHIAAGVSVCWMSTYKALIVSGGNMTTGAYTMIHPGLSPYLDFPDVASIACPKPMMFCCGSRDDLFPVASIKEAFAKMHKVWDSQNVGGNLVTKLYDSPHEYNLMMQADAFHWLDKMFRQPANK